MRSQKFVSFNYLPFKLQRLFLKKKNYFKTLITADLVIFLLENNVHFHELQLRYIEDLSAKDFSVNITITL